MKVRLIAHFSAALTLLMLMTSVPHAEQTQAPAGPLHVVWEKTYGSDRLSTEFRAIAAAGNGEALVGVSERDTLDAATAKATRLLLWRIDSTGRLAGETEIKPPASFKSTNTAVIRDVIALAAGEAMLLVDFEAGHPSLVRVDAMGKQVATREVAEASRALTLFKIVPGTGGNFLLIGHESLDALAIQLDATIKATWEKKQNRGRMDFLVDGLPASNNGYVLVGNSGQYDPLRVGPSIVWVAQYDAYGVPKSEITFPGRYGRIARARDGGYVIVYDRSASNAQEIQIKALSADLKELSETPLVSPGASFSDYKISATPAGGFVVAGGKDGKPYVATMDAGARLLGTLADSAGQTPGPSVDIGSYGLAYDSPASIFVGSSNIEVRDKSNIRQKVRIRKLAM
jgi:hypothetical protein